MNLVSFSLVLAGVLLNAAAQLLLKAGTNRIGTFAFAPESILPIGLRIATEPFVLGGLGGYVIRVLVWIMGLSRVEGSIAYPLFSIGYVGHAVPAWYLFGEAVTRARLIGDSTTT